ncbi:MAG TPA: AzlD domain-containing protein [Glycomyces sp.]|nr:AzlD domain-containing protein [Glycomyces sp.]
MPETSYLVAVLAIVFAIDLALRAAPFAALRTLRESALVDRLALWMPVGILAILAAVTLRDSMGADPGTAVVALAAVGVTAAVHLWAGRRTLLSVGAGTLVYVLLVNADAAAAITGALPGAA